jgi:hypothetical protein
LMPGLDCNVKGNDVDKNRRSTTIRLLGMWLSLLCSICPRKFNPHKRHINTSYDD